MQAIRSKGTGLHSDHCASVEIQDVTTQILRIVIVELDHNILPEVRRVRVGLDDIVASARTQFTPSTNRIGLHYSGILSHRIACESHDPKEQQ